MGTKNCNRLLNVVCQTPISDSKGRAASFPERLPLVYSYIRFADTSPSSPPPSYAYIFNKSASLYKVTSQLDVATTAARGRTARGLNRADKLGFEATSCALATFMGTIIKECLHAKYPD